MSCGLFNFAGRPECQASGAAFARVYSGEIDRLLSRRRLSSLS